MYTYVQKLTTSIGISPLPVYLYVELDVDHPDGPARVEAPDPDGGVLAAGDHQLWRHMDTSHLRKFGKV